MATPAVERPDSKGIAGTYNAASGGGDRVPPGALLHVKNTSGAGITVTMVTPAVVDTDLAVADRTSNSVPATTGALFIRVPNDPNFRDPADGLVALTWSATSGVTFAVLS